MADNIMTGMQVNRDRARAHRRKAADADRRREESWERSDTDGFLSQWANQKTSELENLKADIAEAGDTAIFTGLYEGDRRVKAKLIPSKFRPWENRYVWLIHEDEKAIRDARGSAFIPEGKNSRVQKKLGLAERRERAPAYAFMNGRGTGLSGTCWAQTARSNPDDWGSDATLEDDDAK